MTITIGFSPCPNDTFIFDALVNGKIDTKGIRFEPVLEDVETLNRWAIEGKLDITKLSFPAFFQSLDQYVLLNSGSALGKGVGPLLIGTDEVMTADIPSKNIAIPGIHTTANLLLAFAYPDASQKEPMLFSAIEDAVLNKETDLGVIIHENRFTYSQRGLIKIKDLGEFWEEKMEVPVPLGGIAIQRKIDNNIKTTVDQLIRDSLEYAWQHYPTVTDYVKQHAQAMNEEVMLQHIDLYVNNYSLNLGEDGKAAIETLYGVFKAMQHENASGERNLFLQPVVM